MTSSVRDTIRDWIHEMQTDVEQEGGLSLLGLVHHNGQGHEVPIHAISSKAQGGGKWGNADALADMFDAISTRHAMGCVGGGAQQFTLNACFGTSGKPTRMLPFARMGMMHHGPIPGGGLGSEAPTAAGLTQMAQRMADITLSGAVQKDAAVTQLMAGMIKELREAYTNMFAESRELFIGLRKLLIETAGTQQEQALRAITAKRNAALTHEAMKMLPAALNGLTGRDIFPSGTADTVHLRNIMLMFDEDQLALYGKAVSAKGPEAEAAFALLVNRLAELKKQEAEEEKRLKDIVGDRNPDYEAGEYDAAGVIDPRKALNSALNRAEHASGQRHGVAEPRVLTNGKPAAPPAAEAGAGSTGHPDAKLWDDFFARVGDQAGVLLVMLDDKDPALAARMRARHEVFQKNGETR